MNPVMGIDSNSYGFHWVLHTTQGLTFGRLQSEEGDARSRRMETYYYARDKVFCHIPDGCHVFLEEALVLAKNTETTRKLVMIAGTIEAAFWQERANAWLWSVDISTWRKVVLGKGGGRKVEMKALARAVVEEKLNDPMLLGAGDVKEAILNDDNYCDAFCLMLYGMGVG